MNATMSASDSSFSMTSSVIWLRIARDALFCDTNTLSPSQIGHATRLAMASTRSACVAGPVDRNAPTARKPATTKASSTQPGHRLRRLFSADRLRRHLVLLAELLEDRVELLGRDLRDQPQLHDATRVDDPRLRHRGDAERHREVVELGVDLRPVAATLLEELVDLVLASRARSPSTARRRRNRAVPGWRRTRPAPGCSCMHGTHSGSKKLSTTQLPLRRDRSNGVPSSSVPVASGAGRPSSGESDISPSFGSAPASTTNSPARTAKTTSTIHGARRRRLRPALGGIRRVGR